MYFIRGKCACFFMQNIISYFDFGDHKRTRSDTDYDVMYLSAVVHIHSRSDVLTNTMIYHTDTSSSESMNMMC